MLRLILIALMALPCAVSAQDCSPDALAKELLRRNDVDQAARKASMADPTNGELVLRVVEIDRDSTAFMRTVLEKCGWPKKSVVGAEAAKAAWRLTQHADLDPEYQVLASRQLKYAVYEGEVEPWDLAVLVDRNRRLNDQPQVYGMQYLNEPGNVIRFFDIATPWQLDERRKEIGLPPFYCWALQISRQNHGAALEWPAGVLLRPQECAEAP